MEGKEVMTLRLEEQGTQALVVNTSNILKERWGQPLMEEDWVVLCLTPYQSIQGRRVDRAARKSEGSLSNDRETEGRAKT